MTTDTGSSSSEDVVAPLLETAKGSEEIFEGQTSLWWWWWWWWWKEVLDAEEAKRQLLLSLPMVLTNLFYCLITLVSVMFAGHLGELELAGATLANSWATVTGFAFLTGLSGGLETLCGQGFGAKLYKMLGIYLQASCIISLFFSVVISLIWFYTEPILILLHQDPQISNTAALYMKYLIPGLFAYGLLQNILRFLQTQSVVALPVLFSMVPFCVHIGVCYAMVNFTALGFKGAPLAASISLWISVVVLVIYVLCSKEFEHTWDGFSLESLGYVLTNLRLALPSAAMTCLEYWASEILVFLAGLMPSSKKTTSLIAMCENTADVACMLADGLSAAASTRVSNELGASNPDGAKKAMSVTIKLSVLLALAFPLALGFGRSIWADLFSNSSEIIKELASMTPLLAISITLDSVQRVLSGVARGCGWQQSAVYANLGTLYFIGVPISCLLAFKLRLYAKGLWIGLVCGLACDTGTLLFITARAKWERTDLAISTDEENPVFL